MRLVCPKCSAAYEIPARAIPADGREVQCSTCTHAWYQLPPQAAPADVTMSGTAPSPDSGTAAGNTGATAAPAPGTRTDKQDPTPPDDAPEPIADLPRRPIDPAVLEVLRSEAQRETSARRRSAPGKTPAQQPPPVQAPTTAETKTPARPPAAQQEPAPDRRLDRQERLKAADGAGRPSGKKPSPQPGPPDARPRQDAPAPAAKTPAAKTPAPPKLRPSPPPDDRPGTGPENADQIRSGNSSQERPGAPPQSAQPAPAQGALVRRPSDGLPMVLSGRDLAVIEARRRRAGFRLGFGTTAGLLCAALALFLAAPALTDRLPVAAPLFERVVQGGEVVQTHLAGTLRASLDALADLGRTPDEK